MTTGIRKLLITLICAGFSTIIMFGQDSELISADNVERLRSVQQIDYADLEADINIGWFVANEDASEFIVFDNDSNILWITDDGEFQSWSYVINPEEQVFTMIDAVYFREFHFILYVLDDKYYVDGQELDFAGMPVGLTLGSDIGFVYIEVLLDDGDTVIYEYGITPFTGELTQSDTIPYPLNDVTESVMRVGRIELPTIIASSLDNGTIQLYYPGFTWLDRKYEVDNGPAVFGAVNSTFAGSTHFAWSDPNSTNLNLLDLETGENQVIAELNNLYAQYYLLSQDASLVIAVNVDFTPNVIAWDTDTGKRYDLGEYRDCERIPDKVELSADGTTLIIGCDTGLDIWRIADT